MTPLGLAVKFFQHFVYIAEALNHFEHKGGVSLWDEGDGFFYDVLRAPTGSALSVKVRSFVGLVPLFAVDSLEPDIFDQAGRSEFAAQILWFIRRHPNLAGLVVKTTGRDEGRGIALETDTRRLGISLVDESRLRRILRRVLDPGEFLGPYGIRSVSKAYERDPYEVGIDGLRYRLQYAPAESLNRDFGGNSNWRGPVWFPVNYLLLEALQRYHHFLGEDFKVECPTGSGTMLNLEQVAADIGRRLVSLFERGDRGRRPVYGGTEVFQSDPHWRDLILFFQGSTSPRRTTAAGLSAHRIRPDGRDWSPISSSSGPSTRPGGPPTVTGL